MSSMSTINWAYIAGFFDGEGTIGISYRDRRWKPKVRVQLYQKDPEVLKRIHRATGLGRLHCIHRTDQKDPNYTTWALSIGRKDEMREFLTGIHKYTIVKRDKVEAAMEVLGG